MPRASLGVKGRAPADATLLAAIGVKPETSTEPHFWTISEYEFKHAIADVRGKSATELLEIYHTLMISMDLKLNDGGCNYMVDDDPDNVFQVCFVSLHTAAPTTPQNDTR